MFIVHQSRYFVSHIKRHLFMKKDAESLPRPQNYLALTTSFQNPYNKTIKLSYTFYLADKFFYQSVDLIRLLQ